MKHLRGGHSRAATDHLQLLHKSWIFEMGGGLWVGMKFWVEVRAIEDLLKGVGAAGRVDFHFSLLQILFQASVVRIDFQTL